MTQHLCKGILVQMSLSQWMSGEELFWLAIGNINDSTVFLSFNEFGLTEEELA